VCKGVAVCSELGADPALWSPSSPLWPKAWFGEATKAFEVAYQAAEAGELREAVEALERTRGAELREWFDVHAQNTGKFRVAHFGRQPVLADAVDLDPLRRVDRFQKDVFDRDGYSCRYCGTSVFSKPTFQRFEKLVGSDIFRASGDNKTRHGARMAFGATLDHVEPWNRGGRTDPSNLVTACWPCNYGKAEYTLAELGLNDPRDS
jgi:5-methylcytosine-specific restriction endonuclease McrA